MPPLRIYLVEDSAVIRESLTATLAELALARVVGWCADEIAATRWMVRTGGRADLMIVDLFLHGGSGLGVLRAAAQHTPGLRRVVLSHYVNDDMRRHCLSLGADRVFDKGADLDALIDYCCELSQRVLAK